MLQLGCTLPLWGVASALAHVAVVDVQVRAMRALRASIVTHGAQPPDAILLCETTEIHIIPKLPPSVLSSTELPVAENSALPAPSVLRMTTDSSLDSLWLGLHPDACCRLV